MVVKRRGNKYVTLSKKGRVLGRHKTRKGAQAQLAAIHASQRRR